jgi:hypothetical protein
MQLRTNKGLMRFILFLICFQFLSLALTPGDSAELLTRKTHTFNTVHSKALSLSIFLEENKSEKEGENDNKLLHCAEIADFYYVSHLLTQIHTPVVSIVPIEQQFDLKPPLFTLHHIFII